MEASRAASASPGSMSPVARTEPHRTRRARPKAPSTSVIHWLAWSGTLEGSPSVPNRTSPIAAAVRVPSRIDPNATPTPVKSFATKSSARRTGRTRIIAAVPSARSSAHRIANRTSRTMAFSGNTPVAQVPKSAAISQSTASLLPGCT